MALNLSADRGLLFRIVHVRNLPWLLANGLHCANSPLKDPDFIPIGKADLIQDRAKRAVPLPPYGTLSDYVPFYFTPKSPMLLNIKTGRNGVTQRPNDEIAVLVTSIEAIHKAGVTMLFTDRHAYMRTARWSALAEDLADMVDWDILRRHDFGRSDTYPDKMDRYQAEALAHTLVPATALLGIAGSSEAAKVEIEAVIRESGASIPALKCPSWYF